MRCAGAIVAAALLALTLAAGAQARQQVLARNGTAAADTCNPAKPPGPPFVKLDARWGNGAAFIVKEPITGPNLGCVLGLQYQIVSGNAPVPSRLGWKDTGGVHKISTFGPKGKLTLFARAFGSFNSTTLYGRAASRSTTLVVQQPY